ncbi:MAG: glutamyl-tRNA reductase [Planctomycetota bacterium]|nr:MAG: glutamyl-tRNA reductase [Planctomycetota bacterium]
MAAAVQATSDRLAVVATSYRRVGFGRLGTFAIAPDATEELRALRSALGAEELVFLSTCNRVECYLLLPKGAVPSAEHLSERLKDFYAARGAEPAADTFFARTGAEALEHLLRVVSSLDSLLVGETEIAGQARRALERCARQGLCGAGLRPFFERAVACSRRVRSETAVGSISPSVATIALQKVKKHFGKEGPGVAVLVGVGDMCRKVAQALSAGRSRVVVVNRTLERAQEFCDRYGGEPMSLERFRASPPAWIDLLFTATSAEETVVRATDLEPALAARRTAGLLRPLVVCDLGLPRDVDPALDAAPGVRVVDMERMRTIAERNRVALEAEAERAAEVVAAELARCLREERFGCLAEVSTCSMLERRLPHLGAEDREAILRFVTGLARRMARQPYDLTG